jgi:glycosyltransferase involved in cell wall biosynthesis
MNIAMFTNTYLPHVGGVARSVDFFAEDLRNLGHEVLVIAPSFSEDSEKEEEGRVLRVPAIQNFNGSDFSLRIALPFVIAERIKKFRPQLIHSHHPYLLGDAALRTARRQALPLVFTHHTLYEKYTHYVPMDSEVMKRFVVNLSTEYANLCTRVVAPSRSIAVLLRERGVTAPIEEIPTGVDLEFFRKGRKKRFLTSHQIPEGEPVMGHVGRLAPEKNLAYLAGALADYLKKNQGTFLVVGEGPSEEEIRRTFQEEGLEHKLVMAGKKTGRDLSDAYKAMDLFVFASMTETQGMVLVEAMAAGRPVIALDAPGSRDVVEDGRNGRLLGGHATKEAFAEAIGEFFRDAETARRWKEAAQATAEAHARHFMAERMLKLYETAFETQPQVEPSSDELVPLAKLLRGLKAEWDLMAEKTAASVRTLTE